MRNIYSDRCCCLMDYGDFKLCYEYNYQGWFSETDVLNNKIKHHFKNDIFNLLFIKIKKVREVVKIPLPIKYKTKNYFLFKKDVPLDREYKTIRIERTYSRNETLINVLLKYFEELGEEYFATFSDTMIYIIETYNIIEECNSKYTDREKVKLRTELEMLIMKTIEFVSKDYKNIALAKIDIIKNDENIKREVAEDRYTKTLDEIKIRAEFFDRLNKEECDKNVRN